LSEICCEHPLQLSVIPAITCEVAFPGDLAVHILGEAATELIHIGQAVFNPKGSIDYFILNTSNYPTLAEAYKIAGLDAWNPMTR
jgi:hypothetical protein